MGVARLPMPSCPEGSWNSGKVASSKSDSKSAESTYELLPPPNPRLLQFHENRFSFSFSAFLGKTVPAANPLGVPMGVVSAVEE